MLYTCKITFIIPLFYKDLLSYNDNSEEYKQYIPLEIHGPIWVAILTFY